MSAHHVMSARQRRHAAQLCGQRTRPLQTLSNFREMHQGSVNSQLWIVREECYANFVFARRRKKYLAARSPVNFNQIGPRNNRVVAGESETRKPRTPRTEVCPFPH